MHTTQKLRSQKTVSLGRPEPMMAWSRIGAKKQRCSTDTTESAAGRRPEANGFTSTWDR
eukprot:m.78858 g.78858  ORF g.78858 m.78858 type:complete len:59 (+) comp10753_c0_seq2:101-277(+)